MNCFPASGRISTTVAMLALFGHAFYATTACAQVNIVSGSYSQDFGVVDIITWNDNVTYPGWYAIRHTTPISGAIPHSNITAAAPTNGGGFYSYECSGNNDQKIGSRPSNTLPGAVGQYIRYGLLLRNTTGFAISSVRVSYEGYQLSLAENDGVANTLEFHYATGVAAPAMTVAGTAVAALNYTAPNNDLGGSTNQLAGYPCTVTQTKTACIPVSLANNAYILLRWSDRNDTNNDPHLALDDVVVDFGVAGSTTCSLLLPVELVEFNARPRGSAVELDWITASEQNSATFTVERSMDGTDYEPVLTRPGAGYSAVTLHYTDLDPWPLDGHSYYRLRQTDTDGSTSFGPAVHVTMERTSNAVAWWSNGTLFVDHDLASGQFELMDGLGRSLRSGSITGARLMISGLDALPCGYLIVRLNDGHQVRTIMSIRRE